MTLRRRQAPRLDGYCERPRPRPIDANQPWQPGEKYSESKCVRSACRLGGGEVHSLRAENRAHRRFCERCGDDRVQARPVTRRGARVRRGGNLRVIALRQLLVGGPIPALPSVGGRDALEANAALSRRGAASRRATALRRPDSGASSGPRARAARPRRAGAPNAAPWSARSYGPVVRRFP